MIKIIDLYRLIEEKYPISLKEALEVYEEDQEVIYFHSQEKRDIQYLFKYVKKDREIFKIGEFKLEEDLNYNYFHILNLEEDQILAYLLRDSRIELYLYEKGESKLIQNYQGHDLYPINKDFALLVNYSEDNISSFFLLDINKGKTYPIKEQLKDGFISNLSILNNKDKDYLALTKYSIDSYDLDYYFNYEDSFKEGDGGVYLFPLEENIEGIKAGKALTYRTIWENSKNNYILPVPYDKSYKEQKELNSYHYIKIEKDSLELYYLGKDFEPVLETRADLSLYEDIYNIYASDYPVKIEKQSDLYGFYELRRFYPENISFRYKNFRESLIYDTNKYLLYQGWEEPSNISYYEYTRIVDRRSGEEILRTRGQLRMLAEDEFLIYGKNRMDTRSFILQGGDRYYTDLKEILEPLRGSLKDYNFILSDFEVACQDRELEEYLNSRESIFLRGNELYELVRDNDIQWIWGVFTGVNKDLDEKYLSQELPYSRSLNYWKKDVELEYPEGDFQIIAWDSTACLFISEEEKLSEDFIQAFPEAIDLNYVNSIINSQIDWIENTLLENEPDLEEDQAKEEALEIWLNKYRDEFLNPYLKIEYKDIR